MRAEHSLAQSQRSAAFNHPANETSQRKCYAMLLLLLLWLQQQQNFYKLYTFSPVVHVLKRLRAMCFFV